MTTIMKHYLKTKLPSDWIGNTLTTHNIWEKNDHVDLHWLQYFDSHNDYKCPDSIELSSHSLIIILSVTFFFLIRIKYILLRFTLYKMFSALSTWRVWTLLWFSDFYHLNHKVSWCQKRCLLWALLFLLLFYFNYNHK